MRDIYTMRADGTGQIQLTRGLVGAERVSHFLHPAWSPDGRMIAFVHGNVVPGRDTPFQVAVMTAEGDFVKDLASAGVVAGADVPDPGSLAWSPDGRGIAYSFRGGDPDQPGECSGHSVRYVSLDGTRQVTIAYDAERPTWRR
jgi:Tol biopolymer transport system component